MDEIYAQLADVRGEALAGRLLSMIALDLVTRLAGDKTRVLDAITMQIDRDLNAMTFVGGDDNLNEKVREIARLRAHQAIDALRGSGKGWDQNRPSGF